jgi:hypothetical protein
VLYQNASSLEYMGDLLSGKYDNQLTEGLLQVTSYSIAPELRKTFTPYLTPVWPNLMVSAAWSSSWSVQAPSKVTTILHGWMTFIFMDDWPHDIMTYGCTSVFYITSLCVTCMFILPGRCCTLVTSTA